MLRRHFLLSLAAAPRFITNPFTQGIASGDPLPDGIVLWTKLESPQLTSGVEVEWLIAEDEGLKRVVKRGKEIASAQFDYAVHADVRGLKPARWYWYQFRCGGVETRLGRTRTAPAPDSHDPLRFAFASCQNYEQGYYTAYQHMVKEDLHLVVHLGDYIYEGGPSANRPRQHNSPEIQTLADYRKRYALYRSDEHLRRAHELFPWIVTWDDHEVDNNYANDKEEHGMARDQFMERRANAYQAYYEHMPLRKASLPQGTRLDLYRSLNYGKLARFHVLDTRQYRSDQPCGDGRKVQCAAALDPSQTMLGAAQEKWLVSGMKSAPQTWNILANQVLFAKIDVKPGEGEEYSMDQWSGYEVERNRLIQFFAEGTPNNPVIITGDIHSNWVADIRKEKTPVAVEFVGTSITSGGDGVDLPVAEENFKKENPHLHYFLAKRGYVSCTVDARQYRADYRIVPKVTTPGAGLETRASFVVAAGAHKVERA